MIFFLKNLGLFFKVKIRGVWNLQKFQEYGGETKWLSTQVLRSDRGREFTSNEFKIFCEKNGVSYSLIVPRLPQQNSIIKRKNHTILNMARSILRAKIYQRSFGLEKLIYIYQIGITLKIFIAKHCRRLGVVSTKPRLGVVSNQTYSLASFWIECYVGAPD